MLKNNVRRPDSALYRCTSVPSYYTFYPGAFGNGTYNTIRCILSWGHCDTVQFFDWLLFVVIAHALLVTCTVCDYDALQVYSYHLFLSICVVLQLQGSPCVLCGSVQLHCILLWCLDSFLLEFCLSGFCVAFFHVAAHYFGFKLWYNTSCSIAGVVFTSSRTASVCNPIFVVTLGISQYVLEGVWRCLNVLQ